MSKSYSRTCGLGELILGQRAVILTIAANDLTNRLLEMGFLEGDVVEVMHEAPFNKNPIAVRVRGALIALRRNEANHITVGITEEVALKGRQP